MLFVSVDPSATITRSADPRKAGPWAGRSRRVSELQCSTSSDIIDDQLDQFRRLLDSRLTRTSQLARFWAFWYLASHPEFIRDRKIGPKIWEESTVEHQARAARATKNLAWVRSQKTAIGNLGHGKNEPYYLQRR